MCFSDPGSELSKLKNFFSQCDVTYTKLVLHIEKLYIYVDSISSKLILIKCLKSVLYCDRIFKPFIV